MAKPKAKSVGIVLDRTKNNPSTFLLRVPEKHDIEVGATVKVVESNDDPKIALTWEGSVLDIKNPKKNKDKEFKDKVAIIELTCTFDKVGNAAKAKTGGKANRPDGPGDVIVIDVTITNPSGELLELPDIAGLIP